MGTSSTSDVNEALTVVHTARRFHDERRRQPPAMASQCAELVALVRTAAADGGATDGAHQLRQPAGLGEPQGDLGTAGDRLDLGGRPP